MLNNDDENLDKALVARARVDAAYEKADKASYQELSLIE